MTLDWTLLGKVKEVRSYIFKPFGDLHFTAIQPLGPASSVTDVNPGSKKTGSVWVGMSFEEKCRLKPFGVNMPQISLFCSR